jgi:hypothetical protein
MPASISSQLLPLAMTLVEGKACVAGLDGQGRWIRPVPVTTEMIVSSAPPFVYDYWARVRLFERPVGGQDEDRVLEEVGGNPEPLTPSARREILESACVATVEEGFAGSRSAGLVVCEVLSLIARRHTGGRRYLRIGFRDASGAEHDWVCPEFTLNRIWREKEAGGDGGWLDRSVRDLAGRRTAVAVGLGDRNDRFPGRYRGRHPLCVGLHMLDLDAESLRGLLRR